MTGITAYKGFDADWTCRGFQFEVGKTYKHEGDVEVCKSGFHACENPLEVFRYYDPAKSKFAAVTLSGTTSREGGSTKIAAEETRVDRELTVQQIVDLGVDWIVKHTEKVETNTGYFSAATNTGSYSAATNTGNYSAATNTGDQSVATNTGSYSAATNTGYQSVATNTGSYSAATNTGSYSAATNTGHLSAATNTGDQSVATNTGNYSAATNTGYQSVATNTGYQSVATNTGYFSAATNTGDYSAATNTGNYSAAIASGKNSHAISCGRNGRAKAAAGSSIYLAEYGRDGNLSAVFAGIAGQDGIKPDTFYTLKNGKPVEVDE